MQEHVLNFASVNKSHNKMEFIWCKSEKCISSICISPVSFYLSSNWLYFFSQIELTKIFFFSCKCFMAKNYHMRKRCFQSQYIKWMRLIHLRLICLLSRKWSNDLQCLSCIMVSICWEHWSLTHLTPYFISTPPENIRKPGVFWRFQGL